jgi:hypothetical protein
MRYAIFAVACVAVNELFIPDDINISASAFLPNSRSSHDLALAGQMMLPFRKGPARGNPLGLGWRHFPRGLGEWCLLLSSGPD